MSTNRKLGENQELALDALRRHGQYPGGWCMGSHSATVRILESLVRRGLVIKFQLVGKTANGPVPRDHYRLP